MSEGKLDDSGFVLWGFVLWGAVRAAVGGSVSADMRVRGLRQWRIAEQSASAVMALHISYPRCPKAPTRRVSQVLRTGRRLSRDAAQDRDRPCSGPSGISVGMPRTVLVTGATTIAVSAGMAESRVITSTGLCIVSDSAHQMSA